MKTVTLETLRKLQEDADKIRNICILAHVDHGKTTLADSLVASNGIISARMVGRLRYMDSRPDEQQRGITMKASAISLYYKADDPQSSANEYVINLIDSPGHVDFCAEVSTATRLCDGALIVVDVVEGLCPQTTAVLRHAFKERLRTVLVINKIDRLITELKMTTTEAYLLLNNVLVQVNSIAGELLLSEMMDEDGGPVRPASKQSSTLAEPASASDNYDEMELREQLVYFSPEKGNVVFASAVDGWGFQIADFAKVLSVKTGVKESLLNRTLWGDFWLDAKTKRIRANAFDKGKKPLFVQTVLDSLWMLYDSVLVSKDAEKLKKIMTSLGVSISARDERHLDAKIRLQSIMNQWLPLSRATLNAVCHLLPSPSQMDADRLRYLLNAATSTDGDTGPDSAPQNLALTTNTSLGLNSQNGDTPGACLTTNTTSEAGCRSLSEHQALIHRSIAACDRQATDTVVFVSKMIAVDRKSLSEHRRAPLTMEQIQERRRQFVEENRRQQQVELMNNVKESVEERHCTAAPVLIGEQIGDSLTERSQEGCLRALATASLEQRTELPGRTDPLTKDSSTAQETGLLAPDKDQPLNQTQPLDQSACLPSTAPTQSQESGLPITMNQTQPPDQSALLSAPTPIQSTGTDVGLQSQEPGLPITNTVMIDEALNETITFDSSAVIAEQDKEAHVFLGFARVFAGTLAVGQHLYVLPAVHAGSVDDDTSDTIPRVRVSALYLLMGRDLEAVDAAPAGCLVGIAGLQHTVFNCATLSSTPACASMASLRVYAEPIVRVSVETAEPSRMPQLLRALRMLSQADPCVRTYIQDTGEQVLVTAGEVHLEKCINDIKERFSTEIGELVVSEPIIPFLETIVSPPKMDQRNEMIADQADMHRKEDGIREKKEQSVCVSTANKRCRFRVRAVPLPSYIVDCLTQNEAVLALFDSANSTSTAQQQRAATATADVRLGVSRLRKSLLTLLQRVWKESRRDSSSYWSQLDLGDILKLVEQIWSFGPRKARANLLINRVEDYQHRPSIWSQFMEAEASPSDGQYLPFDQNVVTGFQLRCASGPLCREPLRGVAFVAEEWTTEQMRTDTPDYGALSGQIIACVKQGCKLAFQAQPQRLMAAMYSCVVQANTEVLGRVYAVLAKRRGRVLNEEMNEGTALFQVTATLPVVESFGFADEIRKKTSGLASPQMVFSHWEVVDMDPFWVPTTEEELLHFGEKADAANYALKYVNAVRKRKGLSVEEKIVEFAEKQRTLAKKK